ncbi:MAG: hypothetical protein SVU32_07470 [Candidatus Nanohaloarchaea archaeon]|nr:hypothetical protein [Candidatus Nanohaloarchaea archaeon]
MGKTAIVILAGPGSHENMGRLTNALKTAEELEDHDDEYRVIFDGAGTQWVEELNDSDHQLHDLFDKVRDRAGLCKFCAKAFDVDEPGSHGIDVLDDYKDHPSLRQLQDDGYQILTF